MIKSSTHTGLITPNSLLI